MKRKLLALLLGALLAVGTVGTAFAGNNPSNPGGATTGYDGQPGKQSHKPG
jgi:hypothetical protein